MKDVFAWRGSPAAWTEQLVPVESVEARPATKAELASLRRLGESPALAVLTATDGTTLVVATASEQRTALLGPFAPEPVT
ncbi:hypothetical protein ASG88_15090 [Nocardioides sp. Soil777]|uniref:hypothetical protein n=1 Tax=Nocardioides sp. Soil777 TaxID=1736409 RepID=UPI00070377E3|nr:hypothetical protein [Nocardioides sp. Soil777]KRE99060.1 hypothetical protein ASG88_15090 [Nocardioides sp. Soil777]